MAKPALSLWLCCSVSYRCHHMRRTVGFRGCRSGQSPSKLHTRAVASQTRTVCSVQPASLFVVCSPWVFSAICHLTIRPMRMACATDQRRVRGFWQWHPVRGASSLFCSRYVVMIEHHALPRAVWFPPRLIHGFVLGNPCPMTVAYQHIRAILWGRFNRHPAPNRYAERTCRWCCVFHAHPSVGGNPLTIALSGKHRDVSSVSCAAIALTHRSMYSFNTLRSSSQYSTSPLNTPASISSHASLKYFRSFVISISCCSSPITGQSTGQAGYFCVRPVHLGASSISARSIGMLPP